MRAAFICLELMMQQLLITIIEDSKNYKLEKPSDHAKLTIKKPCTFWKFTHNMEAQEISIDNIERFRHPPPPGFANSTRLKKTLKN